MIPPTIEMRDFESIILSAFESSASLESTSVAGSRYWQNESGTRTDEGGAFLLDFLTEEEDE